MNKTRSKKSLTEQIAELSTPRPASFHPDEEELSDLTAAKLSEFTYEEERGDDKFTPARGHIKFRSELEDDPKYAGKRVSRRDLNDYFQDQELDSADVVSSSYEDDDFIDENDQLDSSEEDTSINEPRVMEDRDSYEEIETSNGGKMAEEVEGLSLAHLQEDIKKGKAAKQQIGMWDGLLEARIRLQKVLLLCNRIPQHDSLEAFKTVGGQPLEEAQRESQSKMRQLFDSLLELQQMLFSKNKELSFLAGRDGCVSVSETDNEEIPSDSDDFESDNVTSKDSINSDQLQSDDDVITSKISTSKRKRKRKHREWMTAGGQRDYENYMSKVHKGFHSYQDTTLTKWSNKTRLASGKISSKAFVQVDRNVLSQIEHVLKDKERLIKRTRLKRSVYRVLGKSDSSEGVESTNGDDQSEQSRDAHLKDYDSEIFDDDDFYHQLLRELIERKINFTETSDPVAMGRQWLELQKLRTKAKKKVDTKASKGRKIRYDVHPKLNNFMAPIDQGQLSDVSRNDLFSSLFGGHHHVIGRDTER